MTNVTRNYSVVYEMAVYSLNGRRASAFIKSFATRFVISHNQSYLPKHVLVPCKYMCFNCIYIHQYVLVQLVLCDTCPRSYSLNTHTHHLDTHTNIVYYIVIYP